MGRNAIQTNDLIMTTILTGKVKTVISTSDPNEVLIQYEDRVTAVSYTHLTLPTICSV